MEYAAPYGTGRRTEYTEAEVMVKAAAELDVSLSIEEAERAVARIQSISDEEMEAVSGGRDIEEMQEKKEAEAMRTRLIISA